MPWYAGLSLIVILTIIFWPTASPGVRHVCDLAWCRWKSLDGTAVIKVQPIRHSSDVYIYAYLGGHGTSVRRPRDGVIDGYDAAGLAYKMLADLTAEKES